MAQRRGPWLHALRGTLLVCGLALFAQVFRAADSGVIVRLLFGVGVFGVVGLLLPQLAAVALETLGWKLTFRAGGTHVRFAPLLRVRVATDALAQSLPLGVAFAESTKPFLLLRHCRLTLDRSIAGMAARKVLVLVAQSAYVVGLTVLGFAGLEGASRAGLEVPHLAWLALTAGIALGVGGVTSGLLLRQSALGRWSFVLLGRIKIARLQRWLSLRERAFSSTDGAVSALFRSDLRALALPTLLYLGAWLLESVETWLILTLLGAHPSFVTVGSLEVVVSLLRNVVFVVPAGLGVQDLGYAACFAAFGIPEAASTGAAFAVMKRGKELFWIAVGYALLGSDLAPPEGGIVAFVVSGTRGRASPRNGSWVPLLAALVVGPAGLACSGVTRSGDGRAARSQEPVASSQLGVFYGLAFTPAPSLAEVTAAHPSASASENTAILLRELAAQAEPAWATGVMTLPALTGIGGTQLYAPAPATNRIRFSCGITLVSPSYAITAGHCVTDDSDFSSLSLRLYRITPALAKSYVPAVLSGTFPSYSQPNLSADDGYLFDEYHCTVVNRCYDTGALAIACPSVADDMALLWCEGRPGDKYGFLNVSTQGNPQGKEALMHWTHEVLDLGAPESSLSTDRLTHYVNRTSDVAQNYHYFEGAADLLPLRSISWSDGTPTTWVSSTAVDVHGCHGTSGSGMLVRAGTTPVYELVGPVALAGPAFGTRLCEQVPNPGGPTSGKGTAAMAGDGLNPNALLSLHTAEIQADCHDRVGGQRDVNELPFSPGSHAVSTIFSHLSCQVDDFGADGTVTANSVFGPYPEKFVVGASGSAQAIGGFSTEADVDYRLGAQVMPQAACSSGCGNLTLTAGVNTFDTSPHLSEPSTVAVTFPSPGASALSLSAASSGQLRALGGIVLIREGQVNSFDTLEDRLEAGLYALDGSGSVLAGPLPTRFAGDGQAGFEVVLRPGERVALLRQALAPGREWTLRLGAPSYADLTCGLLDRKGVPLAGVPCAELVHLDDHTGTEARLGLYVELPRTSSRNEAELRTVALASDAARDGDDDGIPEVLDNCPGAWNPSQGSCNEVPPDTGGTGGTTGEGGEAGVPSTGGTGPGTDGGEGGVAGEATSSGGRAMTDDAGTSGTTEAGGNDAVAAGTGGTAGSANGAAGLTSLGGSAGELTTAGFSGGGASGGSVPSATHPTASTKDKSGCSCRVGGEGARPSFAWFGVAAAAAGLRLRRQRALRV